MSASLQRHYTLHASRYSTFAVFVVALLSLVILFILPLWGIAHSVLSVLVLWTSSFFFLRDARLSLASSCVALRIEHNGVVSLSLRDGRHLTGMLKTGGVILPWVVLINIHLGQGGYRGLVLMRDSMDANSFRHLRVLLRWDAKTKGSVSLV